MKLHGEGRFGFGWQFLWLWAAIVAVVVCTILAIYWPPRRRSPLLLQSLPGKAPPVFLDTD